MADFRYLLAIYVHAHQTGSSVPPHIDAEARAALAAAPMVGENARCARIELVTALHCLASHFEIACSYLSGDDLYKARNDIAYAISIAAKYNQNGPDCPLTIATQS